MHGSDVGAGYFIKLELVQSLCISQEIADIIDVSTRSPARLVMFEIFLRHKPKSMHRRGPGLGPDGCRVLAEFDARVKLLGDLAHVIDIGLGSYTEAHAP